MMIAEGVALAHPLSWVGAGGAAVITIKSCAWGLRAANWLLRLFGYSDKAARGIYHGLLAKIPKAIDRSQSLRDQAKQAHRMRNEARTFSTSIMHDRDKAARMDREFPNKSFDEFIQDVLNDPKTDIDNLDDTYRYTLGSSTRSNSAVDSSLGF